MSTVASKYTIELRSPAGLLLADFSGRAKDRKLMKSRNEADDASWSLDLNEFERYCDLNSVHPRELLVNGQTEVRIKRLGSYISGGQLVYATPRVSASSQTLELRMTGFLNLLKARYTGAERVFSATQATDIAWTVIDESQQLTGGDFGITRGSIATVGVHNRTYKRVQLKDLLQNLTKVQTNPFDFEFTYNKVFNTYPSIGSIRPDIIFEYPKNITDYALPNDATSIANQIIALGAGFGEEAGTIVTVTDTSSRTTYKLRQDVITTNGTTDDDGGVTDAANARLAAWGFPFEVLELTVNGNVAPYITDYGIGDRIRVKLSGYKTTEHINSLYRLERFDLTVDDNDNEQIKLYVSA